MHQTSEHQTRRDERVRARLRDAESEIERLRGLLVAYARLEVEHELASVLVDTSDAWCFGLDVESVLDEAGMIDPKLVRAWAADLLSRKPYLGQRPKLHNLSLVRETS
jgi:hypothetical protein